MRPVVFERLEPHRPPTSPAPLVAFPFLQKGLPAIASFEHRQWIMDSGAFSAWNAGTVVDLDDYIEACRVVLASEDPPDEVFALDVVGDWRASLANTERMWAVGVEAIPAYHSGEPWDVLVKLARDYPKIAIGGMAFARPADKLRFARQCFARIWPKRVHGFAYCMKSAVLDLPFDSVDSTSWFLQPIRYHRHKALGGKTLMRGAPAGSLRGEIEWYFEVERQARQKWQSTWAKVPDGRGGPIMYLAYPFGPGEQITGYELGGQ